MPCPWPAQKGKLQEERGDDQGWKTFFVGVVNLLHYYSERGQNSGPLLVNSQRERPFSGD